MRTIRNSIDCLALRAHADPDFALGLGIALGAIFFVGTALTMI